MIDGEFNREPGDGWNHDDATESDKARFSRYRQKILAMLEESPRETPELVSVTHRFACAIQALRERGYSIESRRVKGGNWLYTLIGFDETKVIRPRAKNAYYATSHWKEKRVQRLVYDNYRCVQCHSEKDLAVHHWCYDLFNESLFDLSTLCRDCHEQVHNNNAIKISFPKKWNADVVDSLNRFAEEIEESRFYESNQPPPT